MGLYVCTVSAWSVNSQGDTVKIAEHQSSPQTVRWVTKRKEASFVCPLLIISAVVISSARLGMMPFDESRKTNAILRFWIWSQAVSKSTEVYKLGYKYCEVQWHGPRTNLTFKFIG